jgi:ribonucleoside-diphosphate reductase alpha chain
MGVLEGAGEQGQRTRVMAGKVCLEYGNATVIHKDGCDFCTACGDVGQCG